MKSSRREGDCCPRLNFRKFVEPRISDLYTISSSNFKLSLVLCRVLFLSWVTQDDNLYFGVHVSFKYYILMYTVPLGVHWGCRVEIFLTHPLPLDVTNSLISIEF